MKKLKEKPRILLVLSRIYGGKTITNRIVEIVNNLQYIKPIYLFFDYNDYREYSVPKILRVSFFEPNIIIRKKYKATIKDKFDALFFQSDGLILGFYEMIKKYPVALALDSTPSLSHQIRIKYDSFNTFEKKLRDLKLRIEIALFCKMYSNIDFFLPRTNWVAHDLQMTYGIPLNRMYVTYCPHNLSLWKPKERKQNDKFILLFVGNDFRRKGGDFLLSLYDKYLSEHCILKIVSNDPGLPNGSIKKGVEVIKGITPENFKRLIEIYNSADLFIFPTKYEMLGLALTEALSMGLPVIARDVGGIKEIVKNNYNGYLMPYNSDISEWAEKIIFLIKNPHILKKFSCNSRKLAEDNFSMEKFSNTIRKVIDGLIKLIPYYENKRKILL